MPTEKMPKDKTTKKGTHIERAEEVRRTDISVTGDSVTDTIVSLIIE